jgi:hypothetical protein
VFIRFIQPVDHVFIVADISICHVHHGLRLPRSKITCCQNIAEGFGLPPHMGVLIRMSDKFSRIQELSKGKVDKVGESIKDTLMDMAIYSLLAIVLFEEAEKKA